MESSLIILQDIIANNQDLTPFIGVKDIQPHHRFKEDLGLDSLALLSIAYDLQMHVPEIEESAIEVWIKVEDCLLMIKGKSHE